MQKKKNQNGCGKIQSEHHVNIFDRESHVVAKMQGEISMVMHVQGWILSVKIGRYVGR